MTIDRDPASNTIDGADIEAATRRWRAAESRLYPLIMADPDSYELAVTLVAEVHEALRRHCATVDALIACDPSGILPDCPSTPAARQRGLDPAVAFDAARVQRLREFTAGLPPG